MAYVVTIIAVLTILGLFTATPYNAQNVQQGIDCRQLDTESPGFANMTWHWTDNETVIFTVTHETSSYVGRPLGERTTTTYVYSFAEGAITTLPTNSFTEATTPAQVLQSTRPDLEIPAGLLDQPAQMDPNSTERLLALEVSPNGNYVMYRSSNVPDATYQLAAIRSGREFDLDIPVRNLGIDSVAMSSVDVVWAEEADTFIIQGIYGLTNEYLPSTLNVITEEGITARQLTDLEPLSDYEYVQFTVHGLDPSGQYLLVDPISPYPDGSEIPDPHHSMIVNVNNQERIDLRFDFHSFPPVAWLSGDTFRAHTTLGVIDYSISTQSSTVILTPEFMELIDRTSFSFDGSHMIGLQAIEPEVPGGDQTIIIACSFP